jgi:hypothetical protein
MNPKQKLAYLLAISGVVAGMGTRAQAQLQTAGELFVNINATILPEGSLPTIVNNGTLGGVFDARGGGLTVPVIATEGGTKGIRFDGNDFLQLAASAGGALTPPPAGLVGLNPTRTIEVWAYNDNVLGEETMVSWGKRGGGDGSNVSFNYGTSGAFGAIGHWGGPDIGWNNAGGAPAPRKWHHLVYTYDGTTTRVYTNGVLANSEVLGAGVINTHAGTSIQLAAQLDADGTTVTAGLRGSLSLARVRIHDGVLDDTQVLNNYNAEKADFIDPVPAPQALSTLPVHRYSFNEPLNSNVAPGTSFLDSIGTAHGRVEGTNAQFSGSRLVLPGGAQGVAAYGDLPNGLLSSNSANNGGSGEFTIEGWIRVTGSRTWAHIFDFGSRGPAGGTGVEVLPADGNPAGNGLDYLFLSGQVNTDTGTRRMELRNEDPAGGGIVNADAATPGAVGVDTHFAVTWKETTGEVRFYHNGFPVALQKVDDGMSDIRDLNVWLGRSAYSADQCLQGEYDEMRIYNYVLSAGQVYGNFLSGANVLNTGGQPVNIDQGPANLTIDESYPARFTVIASGSPPIGYQWRSNGVAIADATASSYSLPNATLADTGARFSVVVSNFAAGTPNLRTSAEATLTVVTPTVTLKHHYTFNQSAGPTVIDTVGDKHGALVGGASFNSGKLVLNGSDGYVNLPNNLVTGFTSITIEAWVQDEGSGGWGRIFDFGNSAGGEDFPIGSAGNGGSQYMFLAFPSGFGNLRGAYTVLGGGAAEQVIEWVGNRPPANVFHHIVWTSSDSADTGRLYVNGAKVAENNNVLLTPAALGPTVNNWLGRAQFNDPLFRGQFDEFSIYDGAMSPSQVAARNAAGPDPTPAGVRLTIAPGAAGTVVISYPKFAQGFFLEFTTELKEPATTLWQSETEPAVEDGEFLRVTVPAGVEAKFYRLSQ